MASRNADRQRRYRRRPSARGLMHVQGWVTPEQAEAIHRIMVERGEELAEGRRGRERDARNTADRNPTRAPLSHNRRGGGFDPPRTARTRPQPAAVLRDCRSQDSVRSVGSDTGAGSSR